jgi:hypothetical protein
MSGNPWALPNPIALLLIVFGGIAAAATLAGYVITTVVRRGARTRGATGNLRRLAALTAAGASAVFAWGALHLLMDETAAADECRVAVGPAQAGGIDRYEWSFVPLRFGCHVADGDTFDIAVPAYVNPVVLTFAALSVVLAASDPPRGRATGDRTTPPGR